MALDVLRKGRSMNLANGTAEVELRTPSTKTLIIAAVPFVLAASLLTPPWQPGPLPVIGPDGSVMHGPDGKVLVHRDMTQ